MVTEGTSHSGTVTPRQSESRSCDSTRQGHHSDRDTTATRTPSVIADDVHTPTAAVPRAPPIYSISRVCAPTAGVWPSDTTS